MKVTPDNVEVAAQLVITDEEFSKALHEQVEETRSYFKETKSDGMPSTINVLTRHSFGGKIERLVLALMNWPPPVDAKPDRYDMIEMVAAKYFQKMILEKPTGQKGYPLAVFFHSEAWMRVNIDKKEYDELTKSGKRMNFADYSDKKEVFAVFGATMDSRTNSAFMDLTREGNAVVLAEPRYMEYDSKNKGDMQSNLVRAFYLGFAREMYKNDPKKGGDYGNKNRRSR